MTVNSVLGLAFAVALDVAGFRDGFIGADSSGSAPGAKCCSVAPTRDSSA
jgi:hypothetical protein